MIRLRSDGQQGFVLIEVIVSALLVVVISIGVLSAFDAASHASGNDRQRTEAGTLAQQDQERLRASPPSVLSALVGNPQTTTQTLGGDTFTVTSSATWRDDQSASPTCAGSPVVARYLQITSKVTWQNMSGIAPAQQDSLVRITPTGGSLAVQLRDHNAQGLSGITVTVTGGPNSVNLSAATSSAGCVEWDYLPAGTNYTVAVTPKAGYVDQNGNATPPQQTVSVTNGAANSVEILYDQAGSVSMSFWTKIGSTNYVAPKAPQQADRVTLSQTQMSAGSISYGTAGAPVQTMTASNLFPFAGAYTVYAGDCSATDPATYPPLTRQSVTVTPGGTVQVPPLNAGDPNGIQLPPADLTVQYKTGNGAGKTNPQNGATVVFTRQPGGTCSTLRYPSATTQNDPVTGSAGRLAFPGYPFGTYSVCAQYPSGGSGHVITGTVALTSWAGASLTLTVDGTKNSNLGTC